MPLRHRGAPDLYVRHLQLVDFRSWEKVDLALRPGPTAFVGRNGEGYELLAAVDLIEDVPGVVASWTQGTVIRSWLLDLLVRALEEDPQLDRIRGYAEDSGEGRWTVEQAIENAVPMPTIAASLFARFVSRQDDSPTMKAVAALRQQFGGHAVKAVRAGEAERPA